MTGTATRWATTILLVLAVPGTTACQGAEDEVPTAGLGPVDGGDWLVLADPPDGYEYEFALRSFGDQSVSYRVQGSADQLSVWLGARELDDGPDRAVTVDAVTWQIETDPVGWSAMTTAGDRVVVLAGPIALEPDEAVLLRSITVVPEAELPFPPLDHDGPYVEVATFDPLGGILSANGANGRYCLVVEDGSPAATPGSPTCGVPIRPPDGPPSPIQVALVSAQFGIGRTRVLVGGIVAPTATTVRVEFVDGATIEVPATDDLGFDDRFWLAGHEVDLDGLPDFDPEQNSLVRSVRVLDADGDELAFDREPAVGS